MKYAIALARRELTRFFWTITWAFAGQQMTQYAYDLLVEWERETGAFAKAGKPFPHILEVREWLLDELEIEGKL